MRLTLPPSSSDPTNYYNQEGEQILIEMNLSTMRQLFNSLDPSPFIEKDLDADAEEYIVAAAQDFALSTPLKLMCQIHEPLTPPQIHDIETGVRNFFAYRLLGAQRELRHLLHRGRLSLMIGLSFLFICILSRQFIHLLGEGMLADIVAEGLLICGWVSMWRPMEIFLYNWWPIRHNANIYKKLSAITVEVRPAILSI